MLRSHWKFKIKFDGYPNTHKKVKSVYCIDDVYIGASVHTRKRILTHLYSASRYDKSMNQDFLEYLRHKIKNNIEITVYNLDDNIYSEGFYIKLMNPIYNRTTISYSNKKK